MLRTDRDFARIYERNVDTVYRVCFGFLKNAHDTEDAVQNTFLKLMDYQGEFTGGEHEKAWLIVTASNLCRNLLRHWWSKKNSLTDCIPESGGEQPFHVDETLSAVLALPDRYKTAVYLYYYEGYNSSQIAKILHKTPSAIRNYLHAGREILKKQLEDDFDEE